MIPIKKAKEIEMMRLAGISAATILHELAALVVPGRTTGEIDRAAAGLMRREGVKSAFLGYRKFPGNICISVNEEVVHGIGGDRVLQYGDIVKIDVGIIREGWIGDNALTVPVGLIAPEVEKLCHTTQRILHEALPLARHGRKLGDLCAFIEQSANKNGYSVVREFVGHGVGRRLHEEPQIPNFGKRGTGPTLKSGMTLAIEPMINMGTAKVKVLGDKWTVVTADKLPSAHFEHTVLVTEGEPEILTCPKKTLLN